MRQRIDGICAHESSNGNRILCLEGLAFTSFFHRVETYEINAQRVKHDSPCNLIEKKGRINSHADECIKAVLLLNRN